MTLLKFLNINQVYINITGIQETAEIPSPKENFSLNTSPSRRFPSHYIEHTYFPPMFEILFEQVIASRSITCVLILTMVLSIISRSSLFIQKRTMSSHFFPDVTNRLVSPVKDLVNAISEDGQKFTGETETDQKEVIDWIIKSSEIVTEDRLKVYFLFLQTKLLASEFFIVLGTQCRASTKNVYCYKLFYCS